MKRQKSVALEDGSSPIAISIGEIMKQDVKEIVIIPEKVDVKVDEKITVKGPKGEVVRELRDPKVSLSIEDKKIVVESKRATKREKKKVYTFVAHIKNMIKGVTEGHSYELKICAAHFPITVTVSGGELIIKNFLGENSPRVLRLEEGVALKVTGDIVRVESPDKELAGRTASRIELITRIRNRDRRIFQDGIFIINKCGEAVQ